ncbi:MAG: hypothetical protein JST82_06340 [Bacteroidetes bacterium]|nr:hypothetical protein [Bacteroidota bacterium]
MNIMYSQLTQEVRVVFSSTPSEHTHYRILNTEGLVIRKGKLLPGNLTHNISINGLPSGRYVFESDTASLQFEKRTLFD